MRLLMKRQLQESIDGIHLSAFRPGYVYQVGPSIGNYLLAVGAAQPAADDEPYIVLSPEQQLFLPRQSAAPPVARSHSPLHHSEPAIAADRAPRRRTPSGRLRLRLKARTTALEARVTALAAEIGRIRRELAAAF